MWAYGDLLYGKVAKKSYDETTIRAFYGDCPPFRALAVGLCAAQYERCVRDLRCGESLRAGRVDTFMATYLPCCDHFVTNDRKQLALLRAAASEANITVSVWSYSEFRNTLTGSANDTSS